MTQHQMHSNGRRPLSRSLDASAGLGASDASMEMWASDYLTHWIEEFTMESASPCPQQHRSHTFHGGQHGSSSHRRHHGSHTSLHSSVPPKGRNSFHESRRGSRSHDDLLKFSFNSSKNNSSSSTSTSNPAAKIEQPCHQHAHHRTSNNNNGRRRRRTTGAEKSGLQRSAPPSFATWMEEHDVTHLFDDSDDTNYATAKSRSIGGSGSSLYNTRRRHRATVGGNEDRVLNPAGSIQGTRTSRNREDGKDRMMDPAGSTQFVKTKDGGIDATSRGPKKMARRRSKSIDFYSPEYLKPTREAPTRRRSSSAGQLNHRRVRFSNDNDSTNHKREGILRNTKPKAVQPPPSRRPAYATSSKPSAKPKTKVIDLPWTDERGTRGQYSGEVNSLIEPHGHGSFTYSNGVTRMSTVWTDGMLTRETGKNMASFHTQRKAKPSSSQQQHQYPYQHREDPSHSPSTVYQSPSDPKELFEMSIPALPTVLPPFPVERKEKKEREMMALPDYYLGDTGRPEDMIIETDSITAAENVIRLKVYDFAWVRRTSGEWTYAIVADFPEEELCSIRFVMDKRGSTKIVKSSMWAKSVRLVNML